MFHRRIRHLLPYAGERISFPRDRHSLQAYAIYHHPVFILLGRCSLLLIFLSPFVATSTCSINTDADATLQAFVILSCVLYLCDRYFYICSTQWKRGSLLGYYIGNSVQWDNGHLWCILGATSGVVILLNQMLHLLSEQYIPDLCKCLFVVRQHSPST